MQIEKDTKKRWYVIDLSNPYKLYWDALVILCAVYTAVSVPLEISFPDINEYFDSFLLLHTADVVVDVIFIIDIVVGFLTAYTNTATGDQIRNPWRIGKRYLMSGFTFDFISSIPFLLTPIRLIPGFAENHAYLMEALSLFRIFKLVRLRKIDPTIANMHSSKETKTQLRRIIAILMLALVMHVQACIIYLTIDVDRIWVAPLDFGNLQTDIWYRDKSILYVYMKMLYHSALVFAMVDVAPRSILELVITSMLIVAAAFITAYIYGQFAQYNDQIKAKYNAFFY